MAKKKKGVATAVETETRGDSAEAVATGTEDESDWFDDVTAETPKAVAAAPEAVEALPVSRVAAKQRKFL